MTLPQHRESILIIEENRDIAEMAHAFLEGRGHLADYAGDGVTGLHLAVTHQLLGSRTRICSR